MFYAYGHVMTKEEKVKMPRKKKDVKDIKDWRTKDKYLLFIQEKKTVTKMDLVRRFMISDSRAGKILYAFTKTGQCVLLERGGQETGVWSIV